ncbi:hypothetical protein [Fibrobacter sp.]|uniref:hypothetical protein n=1 Tax=Fibrobacter sp. TaxID=35828 RepID=UPI00388E0237
MNTTNLKFFTGCAAGLALLCSITLCGCSGAENDISALECFAGSCEGEDEEKGHDEHHDPDYADPNNIWTADPGDCDEHGFYEDFDCNSSTIGRTLYEEAYHVIFVCEEYGGWVPYSELSNCSDYNANNSGYGNGSSSSTEKTEDGCGDLWCGKNGSGTSDFWQSFSDQENGGKSLVIIEPTDKLCDGICGLVSLDNSNYSNPYAGLFFNIDNGKKTGTDISAWDGICLTYKIPETLLTLELIFEDSISIDSYIANFSTSSDLANIPWSEFKPLGETGKEILEKGSFLTAVKTIRLTWKSTSSYTSSFAITSVGKYGSCQ